MRNKIIFLILDAFRSDYINPVDTPFLYAKKTEGVFAPHMKSTAGFTQRTAIFTGTTSSRNGMFTMYTFNPDNSPFRFLKDDPRLYTFSEKYHWWDRLPDWFGFRFIKHFLKVKHSQKKESFIHWISQEAKKYASHAPMAHIPLFLLPEIGISEDERPIHLPGAFEIESLFDVFVREEINYKYLMYPVVDGDDNSTLQAIISSTNSDAEIILGQFSDSDESIHLCGPSSEKRRQITGEIDRKLREIDAVTPVNTTWIIIGDHGMTDVKEEIDLPAIIRPFEKKYNTNFGSDYLVFLDSTMARFKWKTDKGKKFLEEIAGIRLLKEKGLFIDETAGQERDIPFHDKRYGDLIWCADNGVLLFPDFFHDQYTHNKGMHGYHSSNPDMNGFFLSFGPRIEPKVLPLVSLTDVCPSLCHLLGIPIPMDCIGNSLIS